MKNEKEEYILPEHMQYSTLFPKNDELFHQITEWKNNTIKNDIRRGQVAVKK